MSKRDFERNIKLAKDSTDIAQNSKDIAKAAQEDSSVMRDISAASKRDGSSMKVIAFITMSFLPGTFLAVCLHVYFRVNNDMRSGCKHEGTKLCINCLFQALIHDPLSHWQVYLGVTLGLTATVYAGWAIWFYGFELRKGKVVPVVAGNETP